MILTIEGQSFEITNWDEFKKKLLKAVGFSLEKEIIGEIDRLQLVDTGKLRQGVISTVENDALTIEFTAPYAAYLEYGTFDYWKQHGLNSFPTVELPKKKNLTTKQRKGMPAGNQPFAFIRRVLWNQNKMNRVINNAIKWARR